ncbi:hypothetical protein F383_20659 [Gossypium arboreum]|uniref:Uncharacterized protein n=1 Tax=Gossypium arboreum TaxID=29729 RepID=A0A0B0NN52_GOSAR|nr:hypothetical protein F383_20659 [Gossypium arboreum]
MVHNYELRVRADLPPNFESVGPTEEWGQIGAMVQVKIFPPTVLSVLPISKLGGRSAVTCNSYI